MMRRVAPRFSTRMYATAVGGATTFACKPLDTSTRNAAALLTSSAPLSGHCGMLRATRLLRQESPKRPASTFNLSTDYNIPTSEPIGIKHNADFLRKMQSFPIERIRNFAIVAHIDHGKTTLSDAILRRTGVLDADGNTARYMDKLQIEKERGITIKAQTCSMFVKHPTSGEEYLINLIDTPGHVDFQYEVTRSLKAADGAVVLVDAVQGIEAQTMANFYMAMEEDLTLIAAVSKMDAVLGDNVIEDTLEQIEESLDFTSEQVLLTSARQKLGVEPLLEKVIKEIPAPKPVITEVPKGLKDVPLRALIFDTWEGTMNKIRGVYCMVRIVDGVATHNMHIALGHSKHKFHIQQVGIMYPEPTQTGSLSTGMVGYIFLPDAKRENVAVGDTIMSTLKVDPIEGFKVVKPVVFSGFFPDENEFIGNLRDAIDSLRITDPSVTVTDIQCPSLGAGLQLGFLGMLHMKVFQERLFAEYGKTVLVTPSQVRYMYQNKKGNREQLTVFNFVWPHEGAVGYFEPVVRATIIAPTEMYHEIMMEAVTNYRGEELDAKSLDSKRTSGRFKIPLNELTRGFFGKIKSMSHGYASLEYDDPEYEPADLVKIDIIVNKAQISALSTICNRTDAQKTARRICQTLREHLPRSIVELPIQAVIGGKIIARETVGALKKDVLAKIHAGDPSRKAKKLNDQKKGKARLAKRLVGTVQLDQETLAAAMGATTHNK